MTAAERDLSHECILQVLVTLQEGGTLAAYDHWVNNLREEAYFSLVRCSIRYA